MALIESITQAIAQATGKPFPVDHRRTVGGGCINTTEVLESNGVKYFVKLNDSSRLDMFEGEAAGLGEIVQTGAIRAPRPLVSGQANDRAFLVLEYLDLGGRGGGSTDAALGRRLAAMHRITQPDFGWWRDNTIGSTPQINTREPDWVTFYREHRLRVQLELAAENGAARLLHAGEKLLDAVPAFSRITHRPLAAAWRSVGRQPRRAARRHTRDLRSGGVLR
jgi:fructosamine-3-kinase